MAASDPLALSSVKIKDLKTLIETGALEHKDCLDRADLERRASEAVAQTCAFVATLDLRRLEVAAKVWDARRKQQSATIKFFAPLLGKHRDSQARTPRPPPRPRRARRAPSR